MKQPSFLARRTLGTPNYFLIAMAAAFLVAFMPRGARMAVESNNNKAEDWLPPNYPESVDLRWFRDHFFGEQFALVSWDGCTLGDTAKLDKLAERLLPTPELIAQAKRAAEAPNEEDKSEKEQYAKDLAERGQWYSRLITGPSILAELTNPPSTLEHGEAIRRFEGALFGPEKTDAQGKKLGDASRVTCLVVFLSEEATRDNRTMRKAVERITFIATNECDIPERQIHMGGPPVDNITIDVEGEKTLMRLASLSGIVGFGLSFWCFRSFKLTGIVFAVGVISAGMSLAIVFYFGIFEVLLTVRDSPRLGTVDAILMSMPAVVYVLGLSGAIHIVNYYRDARREDGLEGAAETSVRLGWAPCTLAALTTAVGLGSLYASDILPIQKFGLFTAIAVLATVVILFTVLPVFLHRFPVSDEVISRQTGRRKAGHLPDWAKRLFGFVIQRHALACVFWAIVMGVFAFGATKIQTRVQLLKLLDEETDLIHDYAWLEENLGNLVPMEVVLTIPAERLRSGDENAEEDGQQYRMTMLERLSLLREIESRIQDFPEISKVLSVAAFTPGKTDSGNSIIDDSGDYTKSKFLEENREILFAGDYLREEHQTSDQDAAGARELWRISARVAALGNDADGVDYGLFVEQLKSVVDPVLLSYQQRDEIIGKLHAAGKRLEGAQLCILYRTPGDDPVPGPASQESTLGGLLQHSGVRPKELPGGAKLKGVTYYNLASFDKHENEPGYLDRIIDLLGEHVALVLVSAGTDPTAKMFAENGLQVIDVSQISPVLGSAVTPLARGDQPRSIRAVYTGMIPLVYKTQRQLLISLYESMMWATALIALVMMFVLRSPIAGLLSMFPNVFPIVLVFGGLGWLGIKVDIGIMMTASVALGVAVDDTVHFLTWFRRGVAMGLDRVEASMLAYDRCATAMVQTTIIGGLGLAVFATSTFTPTQQFGYLMITMLGAALLGDLLLLPAMLSSPLGIFFGGKAPEKKASQSALQWIEGRTEPPIAPEPLELDPVVLAKQSAELPVPPAPPVVASLVPTAEEEQQLREGPHAALHAKLRGLRRESEDSVSS